MKRREQAIHPEKSLHKFEIDSGRCRALIEKLGCFLPQMAAANHEKRITLGQEHAHKVQVDLALENGEEVNSEYGVDDDRSTLSHAEDRVHALNKRSIEMTLALGEFDPKGIGSFLTSKEVNFAGTDGSTIASSLIEGEKEEDEGKRECSSPFNMLKLGGAKCSLSNDIDVTRTDNSYTKVTIHGNNSPSLVPRSSKRKKTNRCSHLSPL